MTKRQPGVPRGAIKAIIASAFVDAFGPAAYVWFIGAAISIRTGDPTYTVMLNCLGGGMIWGLVFIVGVFYPAIRGHIWAVACFRYVSFSCLFLLAAAIMADIVLYTRLPAGQREFTLVLLVCPLAPLALAGWVLLDGLLHQSWFRPRAAPDEIGPAYGSAEEIMQLIAADQARAMTSGDILAKGAQKLPQRWMCYLAPPFAAARMRLWWLAAAAFMVCGAALVLAIFMPVRALVAYLIFGRIADSQRVAQALRRHLSGKA